MVLLCGGLKGAEEVDGMACTSYEECSIHNAFCHFSSWDEVKQEPEFQCSCSPGFIHVTGIDHYSLGGVTYSSRCVFETGRERVLTPVYF